MSKKENVASKLATITSDLASVVKAQDDANWNRLWSKLKKIEEEIRLLKKIVNKPFSEVQI